MDRRSVDGVLASHRIKSSCFPARSREVSVRLISLVDNYTQESQCQTAVKLSDIYGVKKTSVPPQMDSIDLEHSWTWVWTPCTC
jgi:hypothetical protein